MTHEDLPEDDDGLPEWARILDAGPVTVTAESVIEDLAAVISPRLAALMRVYGAEPTPEGWRKLAIGLALAHERALMMRGGQDRPRDEPGRRKDPARLALGQTLLQEVKRTGLPLLQVIKAYRQGERKARRMVPAVSTLYGAVRDAESFGAGDLLDFALRQKFEEAALRAATDIEAGRG
jgi:hypothetical protein